MSLVGNYCKCSDGKWYGEAVWHDPEYTWFVVLDDDDPPELVVQVNTEGNKPDLTWFKITSTQGHSHRMFGGKTVSDSEFRPAISFFGELIAVPPPPQKFDKVFDSDEEVIFQGVFYDVARKAT